MTNKDKSQSITNKMGPTGIDVEDDEGLYLSKSERDEQHNQDLKVDYDE